MGDTQAAIGFLSRADRLQPYQPRVMANLASARMRMQDPVTALGLFDDAAKAGQLSGEQIADRGLAYDLVSDNLTAQRYYREALAAGAGDEAARRLALSLAIMGDRRAVETVLAPLLQKQDRGRGAFVPLPMRFWGVRRRRYPSPIRPCHLKWPARWRPICDTCAS
jgi:Flp pilus assembly protein TadD